MTATTISTALEQRKAGRLKQAMQQYREIVSTGEVADIVLIENVLSELSLTAQNLDADITAFGRDFHLRQKRQSQQSNADDLQRAATAARAELKLAQIATDAAMKKSDDADRYARAATLNLRNTDAEIHTLRSANPRAFSELP